jgi:hypothetical protein
MPSARCEQDALGKMQARCLRQDASKMPSARCRQGAGKVQARHLITKGSFAKSFVESSSLNKYLFD